MGTTWGLRLAAKGLRAAVGAVLLVGAFLVLAGPAAAAFPAAAGSPFTVGTAPYMHAVGDLNADGKPDIVVANNTTHNVSVLIGTGGGAFAAKVDYTLGTATPVSVALADVTGDGKLDIVVALSSLGAVQILPNLGAGTFGSGTTPFVAITPMQAVTGDMNGDGKVDLIVSEFSGASSQVQVLTGNGAGVFTGVSTTTTGTQPLSVAVADFNGDGKLDVVTANSTTNNVSVLLGTGTGALGAKTDYATGIGPDVVVTGDVNGDGKPDVVTSNNGGKGLSVLTGTGVGTLNAKTDYTTPTAAYGVAIGDMNGDGSVDLVSANAGGNVTVFNGPAFTTTASYTVGTTPYWVTAVDASGDGLRDIVTSNNASNNVTVLLGSRLTVTPATLTGNLAGAGYSQTLTASGGTAPYTFAVTSGTLPTGWTLTSAGVLSGTATAGCSCAFTVTATDSTGVLGTAAYAFTINSTFVLPFATPSPSGLGALTTLVATVARGGGGVVSGGTVTFTDTTTSTALGSAAVNGSGQASLVATFATSGNHSISETYSGFANDLSSTGTLALTVNPASDANLATLTSSAGAISPAFAAATTAYTQAVASTVSATTVSATTVDSGATVKITGGGSSTQALATASLSVPLTLGGVTNVTVLVTGADGVATKSYTLAITSVLSSVTTLASVTAPGVTFTLVGSIYSATVPVATTSLAVTATSTFSRAAVKFGAGLSAVGTQQATIPLALGVNSSTIKVTAEDGLSTTTYALAITRSLDNDSKLSALALALPTGTAVSLSPAFSPATTIYTAVVPEWASSVTVTPTLDVLTETMTVNGVSVIPGTSFTKTLNLNPVTGATTLLTVIATAQDASVTTTTITVTRSAVATLALPSAKIGTVSTAVVSVVTPGVAGASTVTGYAVHKGSLPDPASFTWDVPEIQLTTSCPVGTAVAAAGSCSLSFKLAPTASTVAGSDYYVSYLVKDTASGATYQRSLALSIPAIPAAQTAISPLALDFTRPAGLYNVVGSTSTAQTVSITNNGATPLTVTAVATTGDFAAAGACLASPIAAHATCNVGVTFTPTARGVRTGTLTITDPTQVTVVALSGPAVAATLSATALHWGTLGGLVQAVGTTSAPTVVTVTNHAAVAVGINSISISGVFVFATTCGASLAGGASCTVSVSFAPLTTATVFGSLTIVFDDSTQSASLDGSGNTPSNTVSPTSLTFGATQVGSASAAQDVTLTVQGLPGGPPGSTLLSSFSATGDFTATLTGCTIGVSPPSGLLICTFHVTFSPTAAGTRTGSLTVVDSLGTLDVPLSGTGTAGALSLSVLSPAFAARTVGTTSAVSSITVTNGGTAPLIVSGASASGDFAVSATTCLSGAVAAAGTCTVSVTFTPTAVGTRTGTVTVTSTAGTQTVALSATGTAVPAAVAGASPTTVAFGSVRVGTSSSAHVVTLSNTGTAALAVTSVGVSSQYAVTTTCGASLAASASCTASVTFSPTATGSHPGTLTFTDALGTQDVSLSGTGTAPAFTLAPSPLAFASRQVATTSGASLVTVTNTGTAPLAVASSSVSGSFAQTATTCTAPIAVSGTCTVSVTFTPVAVGSFSGSLVVVTDAGTLDVSLTGSGTAIPAPILSLTPASLVLASTQIGSTSVVQTFTVTNTGNAALPFTSATAAGDFGVSSACPASIAAGGSCALTVTFQPAAVGSRTGSVTVVTGAGTGIVALSGTGTAVPAPVVVVAPLSLSFAAQAAGTASAARSVTLSNTGTAALSVASISVTSPYLMTTTCGASVAAGGLCTASVTFAPQAPGSFPGTLTFTDGLGTQTVSITGSATGTAFTAAPVTLAFANTPIAAVSPGQPVTVTNTGTVALQVSPLVSSEFTVLSSDCGKSVAVGASCTVVVAFAPTSAGERFGLLRIRSNSGTTLASASLTGTGLSSGAYLWQASVDFGSQRVDVPSAPQPVTLQSIGLAPLAVLSASASGNFSVASLCPPTLAVLDTCELDVTFTPTANGPRVGTLTVTTSAGVLSATLMGVGAGIVPQSAGGGAGVYAGSQVRVEWALRSPRPGAVKGKSLTVRFKRGGLSYVFRSTLVTTLALTDNQARFDGSGPLATIDAAGVETPLAGAYTFVFDSTDVADPGAGADTFAVEIDMPGGALFQQLGLPGAPIVLTSGNVGNRYI